MLVKNYYSEINCALSGNSATITDITNGTTTITLFGCETNSIKLRYGSGSTVPTINDYKLENEIGYSKATVVQTNDSTSVSAFITNTGNNTIYIRELAISCQVRSSSSIPKEAIFSRTVLDETLELLPGDMVAINTQFA